MFLCRRCFFHSKRRLRFGNLLTQTFPLPFHFSRRNILFAEFAEIFHRFICNFFRFPQNSRGFFVCLPQNPFALFVQFLLFRLHLHFQRFNFAFVGVNFLLFFLDRTAAVFQIRQEIFKRFILFCQMFSGIFDNIVRKTESAGNCKGITLSRNTDQ